MHRIGWRWTRGFSAWQRLAALLVGLPFAVQLPTHLLLAWWFTTTV